MQQQDSGGVGAVVTDAGTWFRVWAPAARAVEIVLEPGRTAHRLEARPDGWFSGLVVGAGAGDRYRLRLDGEATYPDPWSRSQPDGVHGASEIVDHAAFEWHDGGWRGIEQEDLVIHEIHVGTATEQGTFDALIPRLQHFVELGVTAVEIMPVAEFPGTRNWGYDGVYLFAPARAYGGPDGLRRFVNAAHAHGLAVLLDVVYNHFGPEGNYLPAVTDGRIFTQKHHTPWGAAVNYDDDGSPAVRALVLDNVRQWVADYHIDGLRLDAAHAIEDTSPTHILQEIAHTARAAAPHRSVVVIAEDERNDRRLLLPRVEGGLELDGVWADDMHHVLRRLVAGDSEGYYAAYEGTTAELARTLQHGWLYQGEYYEPRRAHRGTPSDGLSPLGFVHCIQNHDQVGNRALGERLNHDVGLDVYRAVSALLLLSPYTPLLWMGQEWAATSPFLYFTDHPEELGRLVTEGRREEFSGFSQFADPALRERIPDPQAEETFRRSILDWTERECVPHAGVFLLYRELLQLRRTHPALRARVRDTWTAEACGDRTIALLRMSASEDLLLVMHVGDAGTVELPAMPGDRTDACWDIMLHTEEARFGGSDAAPTLTAGLRLRLPSPSSVLLRRTSG
jgi:maltooligosyltrehalose trehalohydrolase